MDNIIKPKAQNEQLARDMRGNRGCSINISAERKTKEEAGPPLSGKGKLIMPRGLKRLMPFTSQPSLKHSMSQ